MYLVIIIMQIIRMMITCNGFLLSCKHGYWWTSVLRWDASREEKLE